MGILKIRQIWDRTCEREPVLVGIDYFDELDKMTREERYNLSITPTPGYKITLVTFDNTDVTNHIVNNTILLATTLFNRYFIFS